MSMKDFQIVRKLGQGAYSIVYQVIRNEDKMFYALKNVKIVNLSSKEKQNAFNQIRILASVKHLNVISYKQAFLDESSKSLCIVMQYANSQDLSKKIQDHVANNTVFSQQEIWNLFIQAIKGLKQLHDLGIMHRDIKSANVFLHQQKDQVIVKLGDMNVSKITQQGLCLTQTGTPYYACPEVWKELPYDCKSDIWSIGCVLYEMIALKPPFMADDMQGLYKKTVRGIYPKIPSFYSQNLAQMVRALLQTNPNNRPTCQKILKMPIVVKQMEKMGQLVNVQYLESVKQLLKTIRANSISQMNSQFPKPAYCYPTKLKKSSKTKGIKSLLNIQQQKVNPYIIAQYVNAEDNLPTILDKQIKNRPLIEQTERQRQNKKKPNNRVLETDKKRSQTLVQGQEERKSVEQMMKNKVNSRKDIKLPKVNNRYPIPLQRNLRKQSSVKLHRAVGI